MATLLILMSVNASNMVITIFDLTVLESNTPIPETMVDVEDMVWVFMVMVMVEEMVIVEEATMAPVAIAPVTSVMVTMKLWSLGSISILLMKIQ